MLRWFAVWSGLALAVALGSPFAERPVLVPLTVVTELTLATALYLRSTRVRAAATSLELRHILLLQALRAPIGALFLVERAWGTLPDRFAFTAGYGDIFVGLMALLVAKLVASPVERIRRPLMLAWNTIGLADILVVVALANRLALVERDPLMLGAFARLPYALLPLCIVPIVIVTHVLVYVRLRRPRHAHVVTT